MLIKRVVVALALLTMAGLACAETASDAQYPQPIQTLRMQGLEIVGTFDAPGELTGYAGIMGRRAVAIYLTADKQHAIIGNMIDGTGQLVDQQTVQDMTAAPMAKRIWSQLEDSAWVAEGDADAPFVLYEFSDPNCPYCHVFWKRVQPWVEAGKVQIRHVMVGVISQDSPNKAAAIMAADDPARQFIENQNAFSSGGVAPLDKIPAEIREDLITNQRLMRELGISGTPGIFYRGDDGQVDLWRGAPSEQDMIEVLGPVPG